jgi:hypothetical protein
MRAEAARAPIGLDLVERHEAHQVERGCGITSGEGAGNDLDRAGRADDIEQGRRLGLPRCGAAWEGHDRRNERNSF